MGFFSQDCAGCRQAILAPYNLPKCLSWANLVVAVAPDGLLSSGSYDGYGRIIPDSLDERPADYWTAIGDDEYADALRRVGVVFTPDGQVDLDASPTVWHQVCWKIAGAPREWLGGSAHSSNQGYFYEPSTINTPTARSAR